MLITLETHCHTIYSHDSLSRPDRLIAHCRTHGIDRLCITDHNTMRGAFVLAQLAPDLIIPGEEILTTEGELLGYFMAEPIPPRLTPAETVARLKAQNAVISVAHPFDPRRAHWSAESLHALAPHLDAIEIFNSRTLNPHHNDLARAFAADHHLPALVGSDAHTVAEVGRSRVQLPLFSTADEFRVALQSDILDPHRVPLRALPGSLLAKVAKALNPRLRP